MLGSSELTSSDLRFIAYKFLSEELAQPVLAYGHAYFQSQGMYFLLASHAQHLSSQSKVVILLSPGWFDTRGLSRSAFKEHVLPLLPHLIGDPEARKELAAWGRRSGNADTLRALIAEWGFGMRSRAEIQGRQLFRSAPPAAPPQAPALPDPARHNADWPTLKAQAIAVEQEHMALNPYGVRQDVSADVILTHCAGVKLTHLGEYGGLLAADYVDPGASSGNQGVNAARSRYSRDGTRAGVLAQYDQAVPARAGRRAIQPQSGTADQAGSV